MQLPPGQCLSGNPWSDLCNNKCAKPAVNDFSDSRGASGGEHGVVSTTMPSNTSSDAAPVPRPAPAALRFARSILWTLFALGFTPLVFLVVTFAMIGGEIAIGIAAMLATVVLIIGIRRVPKGWMRLGTAYSVLAGAVAYLAYDDATIRQPQPPEAIAMGFPGAEESYQVFMRYGKAHPMGRGFEFQPSRKLQSGQAKWKPKDPLWTAWLAENRGELESGWAKLEPVRSWWSELNAFDRIGDLTPPKTDAEIIAFQPIRTLCQHACAIASLQALDGHGDAAIETLLPILEVSYKLELSSRTLVRSMIGIVGKKIAIETAQFVLDTAVVSPDVRGRFATALSAGVAGEQGARQVILSEYRFAMACLMDPMIHQFALSGNAPKWVRHCFDPLGPIILNPRRTINLYSDLTVELQNRAVRRETGDIDTEAPRFLGQLGIPFKNLAARRLITFITPEFKKVLESYWVTEDLRLALHRRLQS
jgi:hypothetical protein